MKLKIYNWLSKFFRIIVPDYLFFISGVLVSAAINIYTTVLITTQPLPSSERIVISASLILFSSFFLMLLSIALQSIKELAIEQSPKFITFSQRKEIHQELVSNQLRRLVFLTLAAIITLVLGLILLGASINSPY